MATLVSHMGLVCEDPIVVERFYTKHFGFRRTRVLMPCEGQIVMIKSGDFYLELFRAGTNAPSPPAGGAGPEHPGWRHLAFTVQDVDAKLAEMGPDARVTLGPMSLDDLVPGWRVAWVADPEGNIVEITHGYRDGERSPALEG